MATITVKNKLLRGDNGFFRKTYNNNVLIEIKVHAFDYEKHIMPISNPELLSALASLGLTQYEAKTYSVLLIDGISTAKNISNISGIPYGKMYELLDSLTKKGFVSVLPSKPRKYRATEFEDVINVSKKNKIEELNAAKKLITKILEPIEIKKELTPREKFWLLNGRSNIYKEIENLFKKAEKKIFIYTCHHGLARLINQLKLLKELKKKGIKINIQTSCENNSYSKYVEKFNQFNLVRSDKKCINNVFTIDGKESLMFEARPDDNSPNYGRDFGIWMPNETFTKFIDEFFNNHKKLAESEEKFKLLTEHASDFTGILDKDGIATYASSSYKRILGYDKKDLIGKRIFEIVHPDDVSMMVKNVKDAMAGKRPANAYSVFRVRTKKGDWKYVEARSRN